ncbi:hypothetical protein BC349_18150 [Flavihumibacter stibioxidans]|uniref:Endonuclease/exonuclease/phosphatase domain-containing protein n=2 Tax=Flavihumibacter stibioxidans TaxID=1834163 RepID=A0ABR7MDF7_9BACT|nr:hypothetical protein [Flavihumibacter stibioxidans]
MSVGFHGGYAQKMTIMTYNIHHARDMKGTVDIRQIAAVINQYKPDLVALQEVDSVTNRNGKVDQMKELGELTGMYQCFGSNFSYDGGTYGLGILSRYPIKATATYRLPYYKDDPNSESRLMYMAEISLKGNKPIRFATVHLDHKSEDQRIMQVSDMLQKLEKTNSVPTIIAGDFNAVPGAKSIGIMKDRFTQLLETDSSHTFPADKPKLKIDYIFLSAGHRWKMIRQTVIDEPHASDHRPVLGIIRLR